MSAAGNEFDETHRSFLGSLSRRERLRSVRMTSSEVRSNLHCSCEALLHGHEGTPLTFWGPIDSESAPPLRQDGARRTIARQTLLEVIPGAIASRIAS